MSSNTPQSLRVAIEAARTERGSSSRNSAKTPAGYNREKNQFVVAMVSHTEAVVRAAACGSPYVPATKLATQLQNEQDTVVLTAILFNGNLPLSAVTAFLKDPRVEQVNANEELQAFLVDRFRKSQKVAA